MLAKKVLEPKKLFCVKRLKVKFVESLKIKNIINYFLTTIIKIFDYLVKPQNIPTSVFCED